MTYKMKHKLKKKTIIHDIIFPQTFNPKFDASQIHTQTQSSATLSIKHRRLSRSHEKNKSQNKQRRVSSVQKWQSFNNNLVSRGEVEKKMLKVQEKMAKSKSLIKSRKVSQSAQISSMFFKGMEKNLMKECDQILKMQKPSRSQSTCQLQQLTRNMFFVHRPSQEDSLPKQKRGTYELTVDDALQPVEIQPVSLVKVDSMTQSEEEDNIGYLEKQLTAQSDIDLQSDELSSVNRIEESAKKKNSVLMDKRQMLSSQKSIINSQTRYQKVCSTLITNKAFMISSKLPLNSMGLFTVTKVEFSNKFNQEISLFFEISDEIVFKKINSTNEKRPTDLKLRKHHTRRLHHIREKSRDKIFTNFSKKGLTTSLQTLYQDVLFYIEECMILDSSYRGLTLMDRDQTNLLTSDQERILQLLHICVNFYFMLRLGSTFYLVKASNNDLNGIHFTFLCDFTTLSTGDQLTFSHLQNPVKKRHDKPKFTLMNAVKNFKESAELEFSSGLEVDAQISAKIGKLTIQSLQKCDAGCEVWGVNKKFEMVGNVVNFFEVHDHFDYGFFNKILNYFRAGPLLYQLSKKKPLLFYQFPYNYEFIEANQMERQSLIIAHLPPLSKTFQQRSVRSFYERHHLDIRKKAAFQFLMHIKKERITVTLGEKIVIFIESSQSLRGHKFYFSRQLFLKGVNQLTVPVLSPLVEEALKDYKLQQSFLYKRYQHQKESQIHIYYKAVHKFEGQFAFVTLYKLIKLGLISFSIYTFKLKRSFIIRLEVENLTPEEVKETVANLTGAFKSVYFKRVLQQQVRRSQKRRKQALQDFFKNQIKFNPSNIRGKRKNEDEYRKKNLMRLVSLKSASSCNPIQQMVVSQLCKMHNGKDCYFAIRYLPNKELKESKGDMDEQLQVCLYSSDKMTYFRYISNLKELAAIVAQDWRSNQQLDARQMLFVYKEVTKSSIRIVSTTCGNFKFLIARLKNFFNPSKNQKQMSFHPFIFRLAGNTLCQTKDPVSFGTKQATKLSIQLQISNQVSFTSFQILDEGETYPSEFKLAIPSLCRINGSIDKLVNLTYLVDLAPDWLIEVVDFYSRSEEYRIGQGLTVKERHVRLVDRQTQKCLILGEWEGDFVSNIKYSQFNKRMFKRMLRGVRNSL